MKIRISKHTGSSGSTLTVVIILSALIVVSLVAHLSLLKNTNYSTMRSQAWNDAMPVVEAGIEDALTHLNVWGETNLNRDGWSALSATMFSKQRTVGNSTYFVIISNFIVGAVTNNPVIESRGYVPLPINYASGTPNYVLAAAIGGTGQNKYLARGVRTPVTLKKGMRGMVMKGPIQVQGTGAGVVIDSYDSSDPTYSTGGSYDSAKAKQNGLVGSNSRVSGTIQVQGKASVVGNIAVGASGVLNLANPASVGDLAWVNNGANGGQVQPGHLVNGLNVPFPEVAAPFAGGALTPGSGTVGVEPYAYILAGGKYELSSLLLKDAKMYVAANSILYVTSEFKMENGEVVVAPGASLEVYLNGPFEAIRQSKINVAGTPRQFALNGMPNHVSAQVKDETIIVGTLYCPNAQAQFLDRTVVCGAAMFDNLQAQHQFQFHYDEALTGGSSNPLYMVVTWSEMTPQEVAALPNGAYLSLP